MYDLREINESILYSPEEFAANCDAVFNERVVAAADQICENMDKSPIVLLSGPSGSGKTTTAKKIEAELNSRGIHSHAISLDNYFKTIDPETSPRTPEGDIDYESPLCLDMELLNEHFSMITEGKEICIPTFVFSRQERSASRYRTMQCGKNEIVIFEGIHALNDDISSNHPEAFKLYISARSNIEHDGELIFKGTWIRLVRRVVRDDLFRGSDANFTMSKWANVRRGEKLHISPFKHKADFIFDSSMPYEVSVLKSFAIPLFSAIPGGIERYDELTQVVPAFDHFVDLPEKYVAPDSLLREFIGGGIYKY